jgi:hypothetical protein
MTRKNSVTGSGDIGPFPFLGEGNPGVVPPGETPIWPPENEPPTNRRKFNRFRLPPAYTPVSIRKMDAQEFTLAGHAYDISEGGIQFELDEPIAPGTPVAMQIELPRGQGAADDVDGPGRAVFILGNVVWIDDSEPGPVRMALAITRFARAGDQERLRTRLASGRYAAAA